MEHQPCELPNHQRFRWQVRTAAGICALVYGCVFLGANVVSDMHHSGQRHGWPFVYMERESQRGVDYSIFYGPWPYDDPPLLSFRPGAIALNVIIGAVLSLLLAGSVVYWLRASRRYPTFGLRTLLGCMTVAAILAAISRAFGQPRDLAQTVWFVLFCLLFAASWLVYVAPVCLLITAAHWIVLRSAASSRRRRWYGLHWLTWFALAGVGGPFLYYAFFGWSGMLYVGRENVPGFIGLRLYGWPLGYLGEYEPATGRLAMMEGGFPVSSFGTFALIADIFTSVVVITSIAFVVERWIRRTERGVRLRRGTAIPLLLVGAGMIVVLLADHSFRPSLYIYPCWLFGLASAISAAVEVFLMGVKRLVRRWPWNLTTAA